MKWKSFSLIFKFTFDVGVPKTLKLPWPFLVKVGLRVTPAAVLPAGKTVFFGARDVDGFGVVEWPGILPAIFGSRAVVIFGSTPAWGIIHLPSNWNEKQEKFSI